MILLVNRVLLAQLGDFGTDIICLVLEIGCCQPDALCDRRHILFLQTTGCDCRGTDADTGGNERASRLIRERYLVQSDVTSSQRFSEFLSGNFHSAQVKQHQMVVCTTGQNLKALLLGSGHQLKLPHSSSPASGTP